MKPSKLESVTRREVVSEISQRVGIPLAQAQEIFEEWLSQITNQAFFAGNAVNFKGFGRFECHQRPAGVGRNPRTGEQAIIKPRRKLKFVAHKPMKESVRSYLCQKP